jgi:hypothetical protein
MSINNKIIKEVKKEMLKEIMEKKGIIDIEKHLLDYLRRLDAVELTNKYSCSLDEAIDTIEEIQRSDEVKKIIKTLD